MSIKDSLLGGPLGFGAAPLGNMFRNIPEEEAVETVDAAWQQGARYFDTAPFYGAGLSEIRLGKALTKHRREEYVLSSKVGRRILDEIETKGRDFGEKAGLFQFGRPNRIVYDYSEDGALRSIQDSLARLGTHRLDFVWVHDIAQDFNGDEWLAQFETARKGAFRALTRLREQGIIKAWGLGVNRVEPCELTLDLAEAQPNGFLLAGRYTLLDHERALQRLMPAAAVRNVEIIIGGPYSSGILAGGTHFEYQNAPPGILAKVARIKAIAQRHQVPLKAAALQFSLAHPASVAIIPGASRPACIKEDRSALAAAIPDDFWREMRQQALVSPDAPLPIDRERNGLAEASASIDVSASADQVWRLIGGFGSLPDWLPYIPKSELSAGGRLRHLANLGGDTVVERLEAFDDAARNYSYSILEAPFPVSGYLSTLRVHQAAEGNRSRVEWSGKFTPEGVSAAEASRLFRCIFEDGLKALAIKFS
ncbi:MAG: aldo/keto reductase [Gammaproteobacteria bacterium]|nr:aldo/keto reductase [Gammaproteobacteria bacterium]